MSTALRHPASAAYAWTRRHDASDALRFHRSLFAHVAFDSLARFDAIHCHFAPNGVTATLLRRAGVIDGPIVTTFHGYDMREGIESAGRIYAPLRDDGDLFLSISGYNTALLEDWGFSTERIVSHRVGVNVSDFAHRPPRPQRNGELRLLSVANLVPVKGHDVLIDAIAMLSLELPGMRLRIVGEGPERAALTARIEAAGLQGVVSLVGGLPRPRVKQELAWADIFVLPSRAEATPVALMEAQACGLPVVATRVGAVHEVLVPDQSGIIVPPGDPWALAAALRDLAGRPEDWEAMGRVGRAHVEEVFDLPHLVDQLAGIYERAALMPLRHGRGADHR